MKIIDLITNFFIDQDNIRLNISFPDKAEYISNECMSEYIIYNPMRIYHIEDLSKINRDMLLNENSDIYISIEFLETVEKDYGFEYYSEDIYNIRFINKYENIDCGYQSSIIDSATNKIYKLDKKWFSKPELIEIGKIETYVEE